MNKVLKTPIQSEDVEHLKVGDIVFLDGYLVTCRDMAHIYLAIDQVSRGAGDAESNAIPDIGPEFLS